MQLEEQDETGTNLSKWIEEIKQPGYFDEFNKWYEKNLKWEYIVRDSFGGYRIIAYYRLVFGVQMIKLHES